jgi:ankyrin repeat protein
MEAWESDSEEEERPWPPIFRAVMDIDVQALRRELASGVDVNLMEDGATPLYMAVNFGSAFAERRLQERLECISMLLEAGASISNIGRDGTALHYAARNESPAYHPVITLLMESGADVNAVNYFGESVLAMAAERGTAAAVRTLISAGAVDFDRALDLAITNGKRRSCAQLLRAGAALPAVITAESEYGEMPGFPQTRAYIEKIRAAGGYKAYEKAHRQRLTVIFLEKFPALPVEMLGRVLEFTWDIGGH